MHEKRSKSYAEDKLTWVKFPTIANSKSTMLFSRCLSFEF